MERFTTKAQLNCQNIIDHKPTVTYQQTLDTIACVSGGAVATCTYKSYKSKETKNLIKRYIYAEQIRRDVQAKRMEKLRDERLIRNIGLDPNYLEPMTASRVSTGKGTSGSKFATIVNPWSLNPKKNRKVSFELVSASPNTNTSSYILKDNPIEIGIVFLIGMFITFIMIKIIRTLFKKMGNKPGKI